MFAKHVATRGTNAACTQVHRMPDSTYRVTFWPSASEDSIMGYTLSQEVALNAALYFERPLEGLKMLDPSPLSDGSASQSVPF